MIKNIQNDINKYISLENETKVIIDKLSIIHDFKDIIHINYNIDVLWNNNYEYYTKKQLIPNVKIKSSFFNIIHIINKLCKQKSDLELIIRKNNFEIDYLGISNKNIQKNIIIHAEKNNLNKDICIYGGPYTEVFLEKRGFTCFNEYTKVDSIKTRPFYAYQNVRNIKRSNPNDCKLIHLEKYNYLFFNDDIVTGKLWYCD